MAVAAKALLSMRSSFEPASNIISHKLSQLEKAPSPMTAMSLLIIARFKDVVASRSLPIRRLRFEFMTSMRISSRTIVSMAPEMSGSAIRTAANNIFIYFSFCCKYINKDFALFCQYIS
jgi:hypothetical protein